jgi:FKBP-type peptidyl-prolyl cis-trans isomerase
MKLRLLLAMLAAAAVLVLAACGDDDKSDEAAGTTTSTDTAPEPAEPTGSADTATKPKVTVPKGKPPAGLEIKDIKEGDGATAKAGDNVTVQYVGVSYSTGKQFDASWDSGQPFTFPLGQGQVIPGWDQGVPGMKVGGRRQLVIPPDLAYGEQGSPPAIKPNETLIFVIDLLSVG